ncbi:MAG: hypothetical protein IT516_16815 [Burkholderiales bacterium]|nr:hypothetical protein [Burkholderiales bacterium]
MSYRARGRNGAGFALDPILRHVPVGASPQPVDNDGSGGDLYVVNRVSNSVSIIDLRTEKVTGPDVVAACGPSLRGDEL